MPRPPASHISVDEVPAMPMPYDGWPRGATVQILSQDPASQAITALLTLASGFRREPGSIAAPSELFVLGGSLAIDQQRHGFGYYEHRLGGATQPSWSTADGCRLLALVKGRADFAAGRAADARPPAIGFETERLAWRAGRIPGPPPGLFSKTLRHDDASGERVFLSACVRRFDYSLSEYHDCAEESFRIAGDMRLATTGLLTAGSYYWRPPYVTHGPFYSRGGSLAFMTVDGPLINHYVDDPWRSADANRDEARTLGPPRDHLAGWVQGD